MENAVVAEYTDEIQLEMASRYGVVPASLISLGDFENFVYAFPYRDEQHILRVTHHSHRNADQLLAELGWVNYLAKNDVLVSQAVPSVHGNLLEKMPASNPTFFATAFTFAPGKRIESEDWGEPLYQNWGKTLGQIHRLSKAYVPSAAIQPRPHWHEEKYMQNGKSYLPADQPLIHQRWDETLAEVWQLPIDDNSYGLAHTDLHAGNFHWHNQQIHLFDTDDCAYYWFIFDLAMVIYYVVWGRWSQADEATKKAEMNHFVTHLWQGYRTENELDPSWWQYVDLFLRLRDLQLYAVLHLKWDVANLNEQQDRMLAVFADRIRRGVPVIELDYKMVVE